MRARNSVKTKEDIINAAKKVFLENGYENTTVSQISKEAGVGYGTVYSHFKEGKDAVVISIVNDICDKLLNILGAYFNPQNTEDVKNNIEQQVRTAINFIDDNRQVLKIFWIAWRKSDLVYNYWKEIKNVFINSEIEILKKNIKKGIIKPLNERQVSLLTSNLLWGFIWDYVSDNNAYNNTKDIANVYAIIYTEGICYSNNQNNNFDKS